MAKYRIIAQNRKAYHNYEINDNFEAGIVLLGSEVKSLRDGNVSIKEGFIEEGKIEDKPQNELYLSNVYVGEYKFARQEKMHSFTRKRKLLLHKKQIIKIINAIRKKGFTVVPLKLYLNEKGLVKLEIATAKGKTNYDKRQSIKEKEDKREQDKAMKNFKISNFK